MNVKLNEIRLGNWFHHNVSIWTSRNDDGVISNHGKFAEDCFQWEESDWYGLSECTMFIEAVEPIKTTEDWLLRLGFEKTDRYWSFTNDLKFLIELDIEGNYCLRVKLSKYLSVFICQVDSIHLLQNAMSVFREEELIFSSTEP